MTPERPDWDSEVERIEAEYVQGLWKEFGLQGKREYENEVELADKPFSEESAEILDKISAEEDRTDPEGQATFDHEEVFRVTGRYIIIRRK